VPQQSYGSSAGYLHLDHALRARWAGFVQLQKDMAAFVAQPLSAYVEQQAAELQQLKEANPNTPESELQEDVKKQFDVLASPSWQFHQQFDERHMAEYVTVALLSHALCESLINAILAIGLGNAGAAEEFLLLERSEIKSKWLDGPKKFHASYQFPKGTAIYQTLDKLTSQRNAIVHHKIQLSIGGVPVLDGSPRLRESHSDEINWTRRFFSLPYDLSAYASKCLPSIRLNLLADRGSIEAAKEHALP
jgi:hypothetical protein